MIHTSMKEKAETSLLHKISLNESEVRWVKYGKEILINGQLFDIKSYIIQNGVATFSGLFDNEETALLDQIKKDHQNNTGGKQLVQLFKLFQNLYNSGVEPDSFTKLSQKKKYHTAYSSSLLTPFISKFSPPPQA